MISKEQAMKEAKAQIIKDIKLKCKSIIKTAQDINVDNIELFMREKHHLVKSIIFSIPSGCEHCPYCIVDSMNCKECDFGKIHGICTKEKSDYKRVQRTTALLLANVTNLFRKWKF